MPSLTAPAICWRLPTGRAVAFGFAAAVSLFSGLGIRGSTLVQDFLNVLREGRSFVRVLLMQCGRSFALLEAFDVHRRWHTPLMMVGFFCLWFPYSWIASLLVKDYWALWTLEPMRGSVPE